MRMLKSFFVASLLTLTTAQHAAAVSYKVLTKTTTNNRLYLGPYAPGQNFANNDWAVGYVKAEGGPWGGNIYRAMVGVSRYEQEVCSIFGCYTIATNPAILVATSQLQIDVAAGVRVISVNNNNHRLDTFWGDWAYGYVKLECAANQVMTGLSSRAAMCSPFFNYTRAKDCNVRWFTSGNNRGNTASGDWSYGHKKGECRLGEYIKGVALHGEAGAILCCSPE
jgi:hypothetical protein